MYPLMRLPPQWDCYRARCSRKVDAALRLSINRIEAVGRATAVGAGPGACAASASEANTTAIRFCTQTPFPIVITPRRRRRSARFWSLIPDPRSPIPDPDPRSPIPDKVAPYRSSASDLPAAPTGALDCSHEPIYLRPDDCVRGCRERANYCGPGRVSTRLLTLRAGPIDVYARCECTVGLRQAEWPGGNRDERRTPKYPYGSVAVMEWWSIAKDEQGQPRRDVAGGLVKDALVQADVMRKERGFGAAYQDDRSGEWEFASYTPQTASC